ncbi:MAG: TIGR03960 family B12-binding radical SAM protein [Oscillospiraceae bacterium]|nr:TIGR03960 family B12-binding radical SAM protein [Oscillospiraceae bacterium]
MRNVKKETDKFLREVQKPTRYTGGEVNSVIKDPEGKVRFAFCFPDTYEIGMSHLGMRILYHILNEREDVYCERVFAPWTDMEEKMRERGIRLFALETGHEITGFDFIGFTVQYEMCCTNILNMLDLAGVPLLASERGEGCPFVCAGGPCAYNPEPIADFVDFFMMGEGEELICEIIDVYNRWKGSGGSRTEYLSEIAKLEGIYVPSFYDVEYNDDNTVKCIKPNNENAKPVIKKRIMLDFDKATAPDKIIVPFGEIVHDRIMLEIFRGCIRGCRFCQAGYIYRPVRERQPETLLCLADRLIDSSGYDEISLSSLSTSDYSGLKELTGGLLERTVEKKIGLSLPSLRIDNFSLELMNRVQAVRKSGITFAPEAGTQRLRNVINKNITEENILNSVSMVFGGGWTNIKLYFMIGLPYETEEDVAGIAELAEKVLHKYFEIPKESRAKNINITVSTSSFVPKPFTAFQWEAQDTRESLLEKQRLLKGAIKSRKIRYIYHDSKTSFLEGVFARGDRRLGKVIYAAYKKGCRFDSWDECFKFDAWNEAFEETGIVPEFYNQRKRDYSEVLPWDHISVGVTKEFFIRESERAKDARTTPNCREQCSGCGVKSFGGGVCYE